MEHKTKQKTVGTGELPSNNAQPSCFCIFNTSPEMSGAFVLTLSLLVATVKPKLKKKKEKKKKPDLMDFHFSPPGV